MPTQAGLTYGSISSLCGEKLQSNARVCPGMGGFGIEWYASFTIVTEKESVLISVSLE